LIFHFGTSSWGGTRKKPRAFTEQGVAMLSGVLHSTRAIQEIQTGDGSLFDPDLLLNINRYLMKQGTVVNAQ